jgi:hypothetical protein
MSEAPTNSRQRDALDREELAFGGGRFSRGAKMHTFSTLR